MADYSLKLLVVGDVFGQVAPLFKRVRAVLKKAGQFDALLCCGSFFAADGTADAGWEELKEGQAPLPMYILGPVTPQQASLYQKCSRGGDLAENVTFLGQSGVMAIAGGLRVAYLSGTYDPTVYMSDQEQDPLRPSYIKADVDALVSQTSRAGFPGVDVLLTSQWPDGVTRGAQQPADVSWIMPSPGVRELSKALKPRYHFAPGKVFYERAPYRNHAVGTPPTNVTRFLGLAPVANPAKEKWIYAFNVVPRERIHIDSLVEQPQGTTASPFEGMGARKRPQNASESFFFGAQGGKRPKRDRQNKRPKPEPITSANCWFCLGSPQVEKHLVVSVAKEMYLALPKGPVVDGHVLIVPIKHLACALDLGESAMEEVNKYKESIRAFYASRGEAAVFFERNFKTQHMQIQAVPVPRSLAPKLKGLFMGHAKKARVELQEAPSDADISDLVGMSAQYFVVDLPEGERLLSVIQGRFPLQFGRELVCSEGVLNVMDRVDWRACAKAKDDETFEAKAFRAAFKDHDFTMKK